MSPPRQKRPSETSILMRHGIVTRNRSAQINNLATQPGLLLGKDLKGKRKADLSPIKDKITKRSALGNITNALSKTTGTQVQQVPEKKKVVKKATNTISSKTKVHNENKVTTKKTNETVKAIDNKVQAAAVQPKAKPVQRIKQTKAEEKKLILSKNINVRRSTDLEKSDDNSLYISATEEVNEEAEKLSSKKDSSAKVEEQQSTLVVKDKSEKAKEEIRKSEEEVKVDEVIVLEIKPCVNQPPVKRLPAGVAWDFDAENWQDPYQVSHYAQEIFEYLKERESSFVIGDYMERQVCLSKWMRSLLVDWMVEVQESFELNHETLYLAVKLVDLYLTKVSVGKETLQLLGAASLFIASKYDERIPPMVEDFLYICDGAYTQRELIKMEINVLKVMDFDLGVPLSYRFLRRYARCAKVSLPVLTLARFILEYSLMDYEIIRYSDSKLAAAALYIALYMKDVSDWTPTLEYYTGYKLSDIKDIILILNEGLHRKPKEALTTVRKKYSHRIFHEVAKIPPKEIKDL